MTDLTSNELRAIADQIIERTVPDPDGTISGRHGALSWIYLPPATPCMRACLQVWDTSTHRYRARLLGDAIEQLLHPPTGLLPLSAEVSMRLTPDGVELLLQGYRDRRDRFDRSPYPPIAEACAHRWPGFHEGQEIHMPLWEAMAYFGIAFHGACIVQPFAGFRLRLSALKE